MKQKTQKFTELTHTIIIKRFVTKKKLSFEFLWSVKNAAVAHIKKKKECLEKYQKAEIRFLIGIAGKQQILLLLNH